MQARVTLVPASSRWLIRDAAGATIRLRAGRCMVTGLGNGGGGAAAADPDRPSTLVVHIEDADVAQEIVSIENEVRDWAFLNLKDTVQQNLMLTQRTLEKLLQYTPCDPTKGMRCGVKAKECLFKDATRQPLYPDEAMNALENAGCVTVDALQLEPRCLWLFREKEMMGIKWYVTSVRFAAGDPADPDADAWSL
jgi:hypothetical protein